MKKGTRIISLVLIVLTLLSTVVVPVSAWIEPQPRLFNNYNDIPSGYWATEDIKWVASNHVMANMGNARNFVPEHVVTRAIFAQIIYNFFKEGLNQSVEYTTPANFPDLQKNGWYMDAISWTHERGILNGYGTDFGPEDIITREQVAVMFTNVLKSAFGISLQADISLLNQFSDAGQISDWAKESLAIMVEIGLFKGKTSTLIFPKDGLTRAEAATLIHRFYQYYSVTPQCYISQKLIPTMVEDFDGEGSQGWNQNVWYSRGSNADWLPDLSERLYTANGNLYMDVPYPGDNDTSNNEVAGLISGTDMPNKFTQAYGFYEIRFIPSAARSICSAFWLGTNAEGLPEEESGKRFVEMDVFETTPAENMLHTTLHDHGYQGNLIDDFQRFYVKNNKFNVQYAESKPYCIPDSSMFDGQYHTVGFLWTKEGYKVYYDGNYVSDFPEMPNASDPTSLWLNVYYWNIYDWAGDCYEEDFDKNGVTQFIVDYIHVYQFADYTEENPPQYYGNETPSYYTKAVEDYLASKS